MGRRVVAGVLMGLALLLVLDAVATRMGVAPGILPKITGPALWTTSRASGVTAFLALTLDVVFGLFVSTGAVDRWIPRGRSVEVHRWLSSVALSLTAVHALALLGDGVVRFDLLDVLVPFLSSYRSFAVGLGVLAAYGAIVVHLSFGVRREIGAKTWRKLHYLSFAVYLAAFVHGVLAGSDSGQSAMKVLYLASGAAVVLLGLYRGLAPRLAILHTPRRR